MSWDVSKRLQRVFYKKFKKFAIVHAVASRSQILINTWHMFTCLAVAIKN